MLRSLRQRSYQNRPRAAIDRFEPFTHRSVLMKRLIPVAVIVAVAVLILATTGGANKNHKGTQPAAGGAAAPGPPAPKTGVRLRSTPLGKILVDAKGRTLYLFEADQPNMSNCSGGCLSVWPALTSHGKPKAASG